MTRSMAAIAMLSILAAGGLPAYATDDTECSLATGKCQFPDDGPTVFVSAKVFPEGFGVSVTVFLASGDPEGSVGIATGFAQEVMAFRGWCLKGYRELPQTGGDSVRRMSFICK